MRTMKLAVFLAGFLLLSVTGCASIHHQAIDRGKVIPVANLSSERATLEGLGKGLQEGREYVFLIRKGESIPLKVRLTLPMAKLEPAKNSIVFTQDTYVLISYSRFMISPDGERWASIQDFKAQKELFGPSEGKSSLSVGFGINKEDGASITLDVASR